MTKEEKLTNLSYESDGKMGKEYKERQTGSENPKEGDFFNITQDSE